MTQRVILGYKILGFADEAVEVVKAVLTIMYIDVWLVEVDTAEIDAIGRQVHIAHSDGYSIATNHGDTFLVEHIELTDASIAFETEVQQMGNASSHGDVDIERTIEVADIDELTDIRQEALEVEVGDLEVEFIFLATIIVVNLGVKHSPIGEAEIDTYRSIDIAQVNTWDEEREIVELEVAAYERVLVMDKAVVDIDLVDNDGERLLVSRVRGKSLDDVRKIEDSIALQDIDTKIVHIEIVEHESAHEETRHIEMCLHLMDTEEARGAILLGDEERVNAEAASESIERDSISMDPTSQQLGSMIVDIVLDIRSTAKGESEESEENNGEESANEFEERHY